MKVQCLYYALDKWNETGGYLQFRKSTHWCMPHVLHYDDKTHSLTHYVPPANLKYPWYSMFGFEGFIKTYDDEVCAPMPMTCMFFGTAALAVFGAIWSIHRKLTRPNKRRPGSDRRGDHRQDGDRRRDVSNTL